MSGVGAHATILAARISKGVPMRNKTLAGSLVAAGAIAAFLGDIGKKIIEDTTEGGTLYVFALES